MNRLFRFLLFGLVLMPAGTGACEIDLPGLKSLSPIPARFVSAMDSMISASYQNTECITFSLAKNKKRTGMLCSSTNKEFLSDFGVSSSDEIESTPVPGEKSALVQVATGTSSYPMNPETFNHIKVYFAKVDCDEGESSIYRPTSTCHIGVAFLKDGRFLYSNFIIENHAARTIMAREKDILLLWKSLSLEQE